MQFNKYHFLWIAPCVIAITVLIQRALQSKSKDNHIAIRITTQVKTYDQFQLYFLPEGHQNFTEEYSFRRNILGMNAHQTILFYVPDSIDIAKLRLDIGQNPEQIVVDINEITFDNGVSAASILPGELTPNVFIKKIVDTKYYSQTLDNRFDPYLEFSQDAVNNFNELRRKSSIDLFVSFLCSTFFILCLWFAPDLIRINKYSLYFIIGGLVIFMALASALKKLMTHKAITVTIDAIIKKDDVLQAFLQSSKANSFTEEHSVSKKVYGSDQRQKVSFVFSDTTDINKIRIDISQNIHQAPIEISKISIERDRNLALEGDDIFSVFMFNDFITREGGSNQLRASQLESSYAQYDPFIYSTDMYAYLEDLEAQTKDKIHFLPYLISLLLTSVFVFYLIFNTSDNLSHSKVFEYGFSFSFLMLLILPTVDQVFHFKINGESAEKRALAEKPKLKVSEIEKYPRAFENYYNDNFGFRNLLVRLGWHIKTNIFKASPAGEKVTIGKDNWIFLSGASYGVAQDLKRENLLSQDQLEKRVTNWVSRRDTLALKGIKSYKALWPDKHNVYAQYLPFSMKIQLKDTLSKTDQMILGLKTADSALEIIDVRKELVENLKTVQVYLKNDTHWNEYGAFIAYQKLMQRISKDFPQVLPIKNTADYEIKWAPSSSGDLLNIMGIETTDNFVDMVPSFTSLDKTEEITLMPADSYPAETILHRNTHSTNELRVIVFRDSFARSLIKFISPHFKEVLYIWTPYDKHIVDSYKPDIVVECFVERYFE